MPLEKYRTKRDFTKTSEPGPKIVKHKGKPIFVIQEHHARRLHWDLRLESNGVLKSWAVTNEPTMDPTIKRLAVPTEDHPMEYAKFKGDIPAGQYGGGHVDIWDKGTYDVPNVRKSPQQDIADGVEHGKISFVLNGKKLKGHFALVQMHAGKYEGNWLLIKQKDEFAKTNHSAKPIAGAAGPSKVKFTHEEKMMFPEAGITKGDLIAYYKKIAPLLLPFLKNRPITLERLPEGLSGKKAPHFWQKNTPEFYPAWIPRAKMPAEDGRMVNYALVNDEQTLLYLVNQGTITFHPWFSTIDDPDHPTFVLFDIDPHQSTFANAVQAAKTLHKILDEEGIESFVKTSGKTGLHVLTPWKKPGGFGQVRDWAAGIAKRVVDEIPDIATTERRIANRGKRVYIDVGQNARGKHAVPPYVVRTSPQATVSMPLNWKELTARLDPAKFTMLNAGSRLRKRDFAKDMV